MTIGLSFGGFDSGLIVDRRAAVREGRELEMMGNMGDWDAGAVSLRGSGVTHRTACLRTTGYHSRTQPFALYGSLLGMSYSHGLSCAFTVVTGPFVVTGITARTRPPSAIIST